MREIKFRAWDKKNKKMLTSFLTDSDGVAFIIRDIQQYEPDVFSEEIPAMEDVVLMQFTGLHDKNGKDVYEGDIVRWSDNGAAATCVIVYKAPHFIGEVRERPGVDSVWGWWQYEPEVIGNIYENEEVRP